MDKNFHKMRVFRKVLALVLVVCVCVSQSAFALDTGSFSLQDFFPNLFSGTTTQVNTSSEAVSGTVEEPTETVESIQERIYDLPGTDDFLAMEESDQEVIYNEMTYLRDEYYRFDYLSKQEIDISPLEALYEVCPDFNSVSADANTIAVTKASDFGTVISTTISGLTFPTRQLVADTTYTLQNDIDLDYLLYVIDSGVTIKLNGHKLYRNLSTSQEQGEVILVSTENTTVGNLTIEDYTMNGEITGGNNSSDQLFGGGIVVNENATLTMNGGTVTGNTSAYAGGGGILNFGTTTIGKKAAVSNNSAVVGGGIYNCGGTLTIYGTVSGNTSTAYGGGVANVYQEDSKEAGTVKNYGDIVNNSSDTYGGGVYNDCKFTNYKQGTINTNTAQRYAGGVRNAPHYDENKTKILYNEGTFDNYGSISSNNSEDDIGGVFNSTTFTNYGSIRGNKAKDCVGGIANDGTLVLKDSTDTVCEITGNILSSDTDLKSDLSVSATNTNCKVNIESSLKTDEPIAVNLWKKGSQVGEGNVVDGVVTSGYSKISSDKTLKIFSKDDSYPDDKYDITVNTSNEVEIVEQTHEHTWKYSTGTDTTTPQTAYIKAECTTTTNCPYKNTPLKASICATDKVYDGQPYDGANISKGAFEDETGQTVTVSYATAGGEDLGETAPTNAGSYTVSLSMTDDNGAEYEVTQSFNITKPTLTIVWDKTTEFTYNGQKQNPSYKLYIDSKEVTRDDIQITQGQINAGSHTATLTVPDSYDLATGSSRDQDFTISPKALTDSMITLEKTSYETDGTALVTPTYIVHDLELSKDLVSDTDFTVEGDTSTNVIGEHSIEFTGTGNYTGKIKKDYKVYKTGELDTITIETNSWSKFLDTITFGIFYKETKDVTIKSVRDNPTISYYVSTKPMGIANVKALTEWKDYTGKFSISPNQDIIVYAKIVSASDPENPVYISSDGVVFDNIAPKITGIEDNKTYTGSTISFKVTDTHLSSVKVNGVEQGIGGSYTINYNQSSSSQTPSSSSQSSSSSSGNQTFKVGDTWTVDGQWEICVTGCEETSERNEFSDKTPAAVYIISYTYKNIGYTYEYVDGLYIDLTSASIVDSKNVMGYSYPLSVTNNPKSTPVGATCNAQGCIGVTNAGMPITLNFSKYDGNGQKQRASFVVQSSSTKSNDVSVDDTSSISSSSTASSTISSSASSSGSTTGVATYNIVATDKAGNESKMTVTLDTSSSSSSASSDVVSRSSTPPFAPTVSQGTTGGGTGGTTAGGGTGANGEANGDGYYSDGAGGNGYYGGGGSSNPQTGDDTDLTVWFVLFAVSAIGMIAVLSIRLKKNFKRNKKSTDTEQS